MVSGGYRPNVVPAYDAVRPIPIRPRVLVLALPKIGAVPMEHTRGHGLASIPLSPDGPDGLESCSSSSSIVGPLRRP